MWAMESGRVSSDLKSDVVEFLFLYQFGITPEVVRMMDSIDVEKMLFMLECLKKKEVSDSNMDRRRLR